MVVTTRSASSLFAWCAALGLLATSFNSPLVAEARPDGSTVCQISPAVMSRMANNGAMGPMNPRLAVRVVPVGTTAATYTPGSTAPMRIQVTSSGPIWGILMYAENSVGSHVGTFAVSNGYKAINIGACKNEGATSSLTHSSSTPKGTTAQFMWTPPKEGQGSLNIRALIVSDTANGFNNASMLLNGPGAAKDFLSPTGGAGKNATTTGGANNARSDAPGTVANVIAAMSAIVAVGVFTTLLA